VLFKCPLYHNKIEWGYPGSPPVTVEDSVKGMLGVIDSATRENVSGKFARLYPARMQSKRNQSICLILKMKCLGKPVRGCFTVAFALHPGWVQTRAGDFAAKEWGYPGSPPVTVEDSVSRLLYWDHMRHRGKAPGR
jgi:hypothetical protein